MYTQRKYLHTRWLMTKHRHADGLGGCQLYANLARMEWQLTQKQSTWRKRVQCHTVHHTPYILPLERTRFTAVIDWQQSRYERGRQTLFYNAVRNTTFRAYKHWEEWLVVTSTHHPVIRHTLKVLACNVPSELCPHNKKSLRNLVTREENQTSR